MTHENPYVGPRAFRSDETLYGRNAEAADLLNLLLAERIVLLYAPSGAGKSSLLEAKLRPSLTAEGLFVLPTLRVGAWRRDGVADSERNPYLQSVLSCLGHHDELAPAAEPGAGALEIVVEHLEAAHRSESGFFPVLVFDQFEEVLTRDATDTRTEAARREFFGEIGRVLRKRNRWAVFAMREEYIAGLDAYSELMPTHFRNTFRLDLLREAGALEAVRRPARDAAIEFEETAARQLVANLSQVSTGREGDSVRSGLFVEPVHLQVVCRRLWSRLAAGGGLQDGHIDLDDVSGAGGEVDEALADYYAESVEHAAQASGLPERAIREWIEGKLIVGRTRGQARGGPAAGGPHDLEVLTALQDVFLIRQERRQDVSWYELAHDRLIEPILDDNARWGAEHLSELQRRTRAWVTGRSDSLLLGGIDLRDADRWARRNPDLLTQADRELLEQSRRRRLRQLRTKASVTALLVVVFLLMAYGLSSARARAEKELERRKAAEALVVAERETDKARRDLEIKKRELLAATNELESRRAAVTLHKMILAAQKARLEDQGDRAALTARQAFLLATAGVASAGESLIDQAAVYRTLRYSLGADYFRHVFAEPTGAAAVAIHPRGDAVAWAAGSRIRILRSFSSAPAALDDSVSGPCLRKPGDSVGSLAFSTDGSYLAASASDGCVQVCRYDNLSNCKELRVGTGASPLIEFARLGSGGGQPVLLAVSSKDIRAWRRDASRGWVLAAAPALSTVTIVSTAAAPAGDRVALAGAAGDVYVWTPGGTISLLADSAVCTGVGDLPPVVAFSADGRRLAWAGPARDAGCRTHLRVWAVDDQAATIVTKELPYPVRHLAFGPGADDLFVATSPGDIFRLGLDGSGDGKRPIARLTGHRGALRELAYWLDKETEWLVSAGEDGLRLWTRPLPVSALDGAIRDVVLPEASGADARVVLADSSSQECRFSTSGTMLCEPPLAAAAMALPAGHPQSAGGEMEEVARVLSGGGSSTWAAGITSVVSSQDGRLLASGYETGRVVLWSVASRNPLRLKPPMELSSAGTFEPAAVRAMTFDPRGRFVLAGDDRGQLRRLELAPALAERVCATVLRNLSLEEWQDLKESTGLDREYECTCPDLPPGAGAPAVAGCRTGT